LTVKAGALDALHYPAPQINDGNWHHVIAEADRPSKTLTLYVDGRLDGQQPCSMFTGSLDFIGSYNGNVSLDGVLDDVRVYDRALTAEQVRLLYRDPVALKLQPLLWLTFDERPVAGPSLFADVVPSTEMKVTVSSRSASGAEPEKLVDAEAINHNLELAGNTSKDMWLSSSEDPAPWVKIDLGSMRPIQTVRIWNYNESNWTMRGAREVAFYGSDAEADPDQGRPFDPSNWGPPLGSRVTLPKAHGKFFCLPAAELQLEGKPLRRVAIRILGSWEDDGSRVVGLGRLQFVATR